MNWFYEETPQEKGYTMFTVKPQYGQLTFTLPSEVEANQLVELLNDLELNKIII